MAVGLVFKNGQCIEAIDYYIRIFDLEKPDNIIRYSDFTKFNNPDSLKDRVYSSSIDVYGNKIYLSDTLIDENIEAGNNVRVIIETTSDNLYRAYLNFRKDSSITYEPQKIDNILYTTLIDKYDVCWQFMAKIKN